MKHTSQLKFNYPVTVRIAGLISILIIIMGFLFIPRATTVAVLIDHDPPPLEPIDIPPTEHFSTPPPRPPRPSLPIESEEEDLSADLTIEETDLESFTAWEQVPPPPPPDVIFIPYDEPPKALTPISPKYPEVAQEAGIEGTVHVQVFVDKKGRVQKVNILKGIPNTGLDEAAVEAIRKTRFKPAKQRERPVGVWITFPVVFKLK